MRTRLLKPIRERAHGRRSRSNYGRRTGDVRGARSVEPVVEPRAGCDPEAERVRQAGGPLDEATYSCECGYLFSAAVCTTVVCPHCGSGQAW